ncbi:hypothetical protein BDN72DRAFT_840127 [Pluteus cervinus]|uniref:Uncharacterized protein n=1 Tax=Pluteus cervinus TaxID=181527 RepID=A0ACD3AVC0_9AGAR|nr:hypothetical protein BDN72DRAFT_840127 [Pluteus cervinus]
MAMAGDPSAFMRLTVRNLTLRFALLRLICISSFVLTMFSILEVILEEGPMAILMPISLVPFLHHTLAAFGPRFCLPNSVDFVLLLLGIAGWGFVAIGSLVVGVGPDYSQIDIATIAWGWIFVVALTMFGILRTIVIIHLGRKNLLRRLDISKVDWIDDWSNDKVAKASEPRTPAIEKATSVLVGRSIWKERFPGEARWLRVLRGIMATFVLVGIVVYSLFNIILAPVREAGMTPVDVFRTAALPGDLRLSGVPVWNILINTAPTNPDNSKLEYAVSVQSLTGSKSNCIVRSDLQSWVGADPSIDYYEFEVLHGLYVKTFTCPSNLSVFVGQLPNELRMNPDMLSEVLITVNFTKLGILSNPPISILQNSVEVRSSLINDTELAIRSTRPVVLMPGSNLIGIATIQARQKFRIPIISALGVFNSVNTFFTADIIHVFNDPLQADVIQRGPDIGTVRIAYRDFFTDWEVIRDQHNNTVLKGLSDVGGLWSFLGGVFVWFFGSSLLRVLRGTKPVTVVGMAHNFQHDQTMRETCLSRYPNVVSDIQNGDGLLAILYDHLFDLEFLVGKNGERGVPVPVEDAERSDSIELLHR